MGIFSFIKRVILIFVIGYALYHGKTIYCATFGSCALPTKLVIHKPFPECNSAEVLSALQQQFKKQKRGTLQVSISPLTKPENINKDTPQEKFCCFQLSAANTMTTNRCYGLFYTDNQELMFEAPPISSP